MHLITYFELFSNLTIKMIKIIAKLFTSFNSPDVKKKCLKNTESYGYWVYAVFFIVFKEYLRTR